MSVAFDAQDHLGTHSFIPLAALPLTKVRRSRTMARTSVTTSAEAALSKAGSTDAWLWTIVDPTYGFVSATFLGRWGNRLTGWRNVNCAKVTAPGEVDQMIETTQGVHRACLVLAPHETKTFAPFSYGVAHKRCPDRGCGKAISNWPWTVAYPSAPCPLC